MSDPYYVTDLESGNQWPTDKVAVTITYGFWTSAPSYDPGDNVQFQSFTATMKTAVYDTLAMISSYANITFQEIASPNSNESSVQIGFGMNNADLSAEAFTYYPPPDNTTLIAGDVWATRDAYTSGDPNATHVVPRDYDYMALIHEIGHALGLKHSFEAPRLLSYEDNVQHTVMSYTTELSEYYLGNFQYAYPETYMPYDIAAIQALYGTNNTYATGNDNYVLKSGHIYTIWDAGGNDTLDGHLINTNMKLDLQAGHYSSVGPIPSFQNNIAIAFGVTIENALGGSGDDTIYDNAATNNIQGNAGNDLVYLTTGNDTVDGGTGSDTVFTGIGTETINGGSGVDPGTDTVIFSGGYYDYSYNFIDAVTVSVTSADGTDTVANFEYFNFADYQFQSFALFQAGLPSDVWTGGPGADIHTGGQGADTLDGGDGNDLLTGMGGPDTLLGGLGADTLYGADGNDTLDGGAGIDKLLGGRGDDLYIVDLVVSSGIAKLEDTLTENLNEGTDTVQLRAGALVLTLASTITLGTNIENLDASQTGSNKLNLTGNALDNVLTGNDWDNTLNGGLGNDTMLGGLGNDTYIFSAASDVATENPGEGSDTVVIGYANAALSAVTFDLNDAGFANIENLKVTGTGLFNLIGDGNDNILTGNASINTLTGGDGNDTYFVGAGDIVIETPTGGNDTIVSGVSFSLLLNATNVENLTLTGTSSLSGTGDGNVNIITGNGAANILNGGGGADTLIGGLGSDTYIVDNPGDTITELLAGGTDIVKASASFDLNANGANVENLTLVAGAGNINGTGNGLANVILGNEGDNVLDGGAGVDKLTGGLGNDTFFVDLIAVSGVAKLQDTVTEASGGGNDTLDLRTGGDLGLLNPTTLALASTLENVDISLTGTNHLNLTGNVYDNIMTGNDWDNTLNGGSGNDTISGGLGADHLLGVVGNDTLLGGAGNDFLDGGAGIDTLTGGAGVDTFVFHAAQATSPSNADTVADFTAGLGGDILDIHDILSGYVSGPIHDWLHVTDSGSDTIVSIDANGLTGGSAFVQIATLTGVTGLDPDQLLADGNLQVH